jgi:hypothetical protein
MIDAWSMRNWKSGDESGHDHFFATFDKFGLASHTHVAEAIAVATNRAGMDHLQYVELMHTADGGAAARLAKKVEWNPDYAKMRESLLAVGLKDVVSETSKRLAADDARAREILKCGTPDAAPGCGVTVRYLYQVLRGLPHQIVFAQIPKCTSLCTPANLPSDSYPRKTSRFTFALPSSAATPSALATASTS